MLFRSQRSTVSGSSERVASPVIGAINLPARSASRVRSRRASTQSDTQGDRDNGSETPAVNAADGKNNGLQIPRMALNGENDGKNADGGKTGGVARPRPASSRPTALQLMAGKPAAEATEPLPSKGKLKPSKNDVEKDAVE